jgi:hypothetical protein
MGKNIAAQNSTLMQNSRDRQPRHQPQQKERRKEKKRKSCSP